MGRFGLVQLFCALLFCALLVCALIFLALIFWALIFWAPAGGAVLCCVQVSERMTCWKVADARPRRAPYRTSVDSPGITKSTLWKTPDLQGSAGSESCATVNGNGRAQRFREYRHGTDAQRAVLRPLGARPG